ncbi:hypothetical protein AB0A94_08190 [Streptomyces sp. NPDC044984]
MNASNNASRRAAAVVGATSPGRDQALRLDGWATATADEEG